MQLPSGIDELMHKHVEPPVHSLEAGEVYVVAVRSVDRERERFFLFMPTLSHPTLIDVNVAGHKIDRHDKATPKEHQVFSIREVMFFNQHHDFGDVLED